MRGMSDNIRENIDIDIDSMLSRLIIMGVEGVGLAYGGERERERGEGDMVPVLIGLKLGEWTALRWRLVTRLRVRHDT